MHFSFSSSRTWREWPSYLLPLSYPSHSHCKRELPTTQAIWPAYNMGGQQAGAALSLVQKIGFSILSAQRPIYSGVGKAANCSFVGGGEVTIGCLFLDGHNKEAGWPLFPEPEFGSFTSCL